MENGILQRHLFYVEGFRLIMGIDKENPKKMTTTKMEQILQDFDNLLLEAQAQTTHRKVADIAIRFNRYHTRVAHNITDF